MVPIAPVIAVIVSVPTGRVVIEEVVQIIWGKSPVDFRVPPLLDFPAFTIFSTNYPAYKMFMLLVSIAIFIGLLLVLKKTRIGLIVQAALGVSDAILEAAALGFLGLGAQPPTAEWGTMLADAREFVLRAWWVVTFPGLAILAAVLAFNLLGDGLRDALDPKLKR